MGDRITIKGSKFFKQTHIEESLFRNLVLIEQQPQYRTILTNCGFDRNFLLFPYIVYGITFSSNYESYESDRKMMFVNLKVGVSDKPITSLDDQLMKLPLTNFDYYTVCTEHFDDICAGSVEEIVQKTISYFWQSSFDAIGSLQYWKQITKDNLILFKDICRCSISLRSIFFQELNDSDVVNDQILMRI